MQNQSENRNKLTEAVQLCTIHSERMHFAGEKVKDHFPPDKEKYKQLQPEELSFMDQLIFRFSKLQDSMGGKLFPAILENLGEDIRELPFIDRLAKLEKLNVIGSADEWMMLRETRNIVTYEFPFVTDEMIEGLNLLVKHQQVILDILEQVENFVKNRFELPE